MSQYKTGTASVTNGSATVTGTNTLWLANVTAGDSFTVAGDGVMYDVASVDSDTQVTLSVNYAGVTAAGVVYTIARDFTSPDNFPELTTGDIETPTIITRALRTIQGKCSGLVSDISGKADQATTYTETEVDGLLDNKAAISGQVFTGSISATNLSGTNTGDQDLSGKAAIAGQVFTGEINYRGLGDVDTNTSYGEGALSSNITGGSNTATGKNALRDHTEGTRNTASGESAGIQITTGSRNSLFGRIAGLGLKAGSGNSVFGADVTSLASDLENNLILASGGVIRLRHDATDLTVNGGVKPSNDNTVALGTASLRWSEVFAGTGTINTSDAREKTPLRGMTEPEVLAAKDMGKEIGIYQFLASVEKKGDNARQHVGLTVQRAVEIMTAHDLEPFSYGFICFDEWDDIFVEHAEIKATDKTDAKSAWTEQTQVAGNMYGFRYDQLNLFIAQGIEARLSALEDNA